MFFRNKLQDIKRDLIEIRFLYSSKNSKYFEAFFKCQLKQIRKINSVKLILEINLLKNYTQFGDFCLLLATFRFRLIECIFLWFKIESWLIWRVWRFLTLSLVQICKLHLAALHTKIFGFLFAGSIKVSITTGNRKKATWRLCKNVLSTNPFTLAQLPPLLQNCAKMKQCFLCWWPGVE